MRTVRDAIAGFAVVVGSLVLFMAGLYLILCIVVGPFIMGQSTKAEYIGDGCVEVKTVYTNWYPSNDKVLSQEIICDN